MVLDSVVEPVIFSSEPNEHSGGSAVPRDDDLLLGGGTQVTREVILDLRQGNFLGPLARMP